jgi:hypothetical protein
MNPVLDGLRISVPGRVTQVCLTDSVLRGNGISCPYSLWGLAFDQMWLHWLRIFPVSADNLKRLTVAKQTPSATLVRAISADVPF